MSDHLVCPGEDEQHINIEIFTNDILCAIIRHISQQDWYVLVLISSRWGAVITAAARIQTTATYDLMLSSRLPESVSLNEFVLSYLACTRQVVSVKIYADAQHNHFDYVSHIARIAGRSMMGLAKYLYSKYVHSVGDKISQQTATGKVCRELIDNAARVTNDTVVSAGVYSCEKNINESHKLLHFVIYCVSILGLDIAVNDTALSALAIGGCELFRSLMVSDTCGEMGETEYFIRPQNLAILKSSGNGCM
jgi:hypothetical protein